MKDVVALILAGGDSTRLWPLQDKNFIRFSGLPLIYYSIARLVKFGFKNIVIVVNREAQSQYLRLADEFKTSHINIEPQTDNRGMAGAVYSAKKYIYDRPVLIVGPSDTYENIIFFDLDKLIKTNPDGILAGTVLEKYFPGGYLTVKDNLVTGIVEKPQPDKLPSHIVNFVFDYFAKGEMLLSAIDRVKTKNDDLYEKGIESLIKKGLQFKYLPYKGYWGYLKYPWHVLSLTSYFLQSFKGKNIEKSVIDKSAKIEGDVCIEAGVRIMENVQIIGPAYIGKNTLIGQNCLIRETMIGNNCVIGFSSEMVRSYIGDNCWFHKNYVGDSVLSNNIGMGAGAVIANFKLNEKPIKSIIGGKIYNTERTKLGAVIGDNVRIGVNSSIMPGVKIGQNSFVGAGVILNQDLSDNKIILTKQENYLVTNNHDLIDPTNRQKIGLTLKR